MSWLKKAMLPETVKISASSTVGVALMSDSLVDFKDNFNA
jgi:hypothetical protein